MTWHARSACLGSDAELFFPERGDHAGVLKALAVCAECEVVDQCLEAGLDQKDGILGGTTGAQRRKIRNERGVERSCAWCHGLFTARYISTVVCSDECRKLRRSAKQAESNARTYRVEA